eukprot:6211990-Pleurochrysis_carterae.AAC.4
MGVTYATHSSRTTGAVSARKSEAAKTGRHAALHASQLKGEEASGVGRESAVGAPASPTAIEKADPLNHPCAGTAPIFSGLFSGEIVREPPFPIHLTLREAPQSSSARTKPLCETHT